MAPPRRFAIGAPDYLAVLDQTGKPLAFRRPARIDVIGGRVFGPRRYQQYRPGDTMESGRFSLGVERPIELRVTNEDGESAAIANPQRIVILGEGVDLTHTPPPAPPAPQLRPRPMLREVTSLLSQLVDNPNPTGHREVDDVDDQTAHIVDNGASLEMADRTASAPDDFDDLVRKRGEALKAAGGDDLAAGAILQSGQQAEAVQRAPYVTTNPPSATGAVMGRSASLKPGDNAVEVARWTGTNDESRAVTVTIGQGVLAAGQTSLAQQPIQAYPYAIVKFGTQANLYTVYVDALAGTQFTVAATMVSVQLAMWPLMPKPLNTPIAATMLLSGNISFGQVERYAPVQYTWLSKTFATDQPSVPVPPFAVAFTFFGSTGGGTTDTVDITMRDVGGTPVSVAASLSVDAAKSKRIAIPGNVVTLVPSNFTSVQLQEVAIVFDLSL